MFKIILPTLNLKVERWKWNKEYRVYVSTLGHFKNEHKQNLPIKINQFGYCAVYTGCGYKNVHRLVLLTFKPIPNAESLTIDHLNHNKRDNSLYNLEWVSREENLNRAKQDLIGINDEEYKIIYAASNKFNSIDKAIDWVILSQGNNKSINTPNRKNIEKKIKLAIATKTKYCNLKWKGE